MTSAASWTPAAEKEHVPTTFTYRVRAGDGRMVTGSLEAESSHLVVNKLKDMGYVPISIKKKAPSAKSDISIPGLSNRVNGKVVALFSREFATLINAGVSLTRSLAILAGQAESKYFAGVIDGIRADVENGSSLSKALVAHPKEFNRLYVSMIRAGEVGGNLDRTLNELSSTLEKQVELRRKIKSAMTYPIAVFSLVILIMAAMLLFVVPIFQKMYKQLGGKLPKPTAVLVVISNLMVHGLPILIPVVTVLAIALRRALKTQRGRNVWDHISLKIPVFGGLVRKTALARFSATLSTLMGSGVPILEALDITAETAGNTLVAAGVQAVSDGARRGEPMSKALMDHPVFPPLVTQMIAVGEETGALDTLLGKLAGFYEQEVQATVDALTALLEPLMIVVLGGAVGSTVIALYLPMFDIYKLVGKSG
jgi:type IV pilus assembly protein PilC